MYSKLFFRGDRRGILIIGDSPPPEQSPVKNMVTVFDPVHPYPGADRNPSEGRQGFRQPHQK
jgi:hypothetical protein